MKSITLDVRPAVDSLPAFVARLKGFPSRLPAVWRNWTWASEDPPAATPAEANPGLTEYEARAVQGASRCVAWSAAMRVQGGGPDLPLVVLLPRVRAAAERIARIDAKCAKCVALRCVRACVLGGGGVRWITPRPWSRRARELHVACKGDVECGRTHIALEYCMGKELCAVRACVRGACGAARAARALELMAPARAAPPRPRWQPEAATFMSRVSAAGEDAAAGEAFEAMSKCVRLSVHMKPAAAALREADAAAPAHGAGEPATN